MEYPWDFETEYRLTVDTLAGEGIYGLFTDPLEHKFKTKSEDEYCTLTFNVTNFTDTVPAFVELLNTSDSPVRREKVVNGSVTFRFLSRASITPVFSKISTETVNTPPVISILCDSLIWSTIIPRL